MKISRDTSHELQGSTRSGDDITKSTVIKVIIPAPDKVIYKLLSPSCMIGLSNELRTSTNLEYMSYMCGHRSEKQAEEIMAKTLITSMVIRRIKDMCGQVISVRYPNKDNHDRQKDETDSNVMRIFA